MSNKQNTNTQKKGSRSVPKSSSPKKKTTSQPRKSRGNDRPRIVRSVAPKNIGTTIVTGSANMRSGNSRIVISHSELIGPVISTAVGFSLAHSVANESANSMLRLRCNPGSAKTFNWLSTVAPLYENYRFKRLRFRFVPRLSANSNGDFIATPDYDAADSIQDMSEQLLMNNRGTVSGSIWQNQVLHLDVKAMNRLFKSHSNMSDERFATTKQDQKTVDAAQVGIYLDYDFVGVLSGKLWVDYEVELSDPQSPTDPVNKGGANLNFINLQHNSPAPFNAANSLSTHQEETIPVLRDGNSPGIQAALTYPSAFVGQFTKDYEGLLTSTVGGSLITEGARFYRSKNMNGPVDLVNDILIPAFGGTNVNGGNTNATSIFKVQAQAGEYLKAYTGAASALTNLRVLLGGASLDLFA